MVGELTKAMEKIGLDMRVSALVSNSVAVPGSLFGCFLLNGKECDLQSSVDGMGA